MLYHIGNDRLRMVPIGPNLELSPWKDAINKEPSEVDFLISSLRSSSLFDDFE